MTTQKLFFLRQLHLHKYSDPLLSTLLEHLWQRSSQALVSLDGKRHGSYFQVSPEMFARVHVRALAGPLKDIPSLVLRPLLRCIDCVLSVVVLLEGEPLPQSEFLSALEQVFIIIFLSGGFLLDQDPSCILGDLERCR